jgi:lauroyl/myristoyl acyltransferase
MTISAGGVPRSGQAPPARSEVCFNDRVKSAIARAINHARTLVPASLVPLIVVIRARLARMRPAVWSNAKAQMRFVVGEDEPDEIVDQHAAAYIRRSIWRGESRWHPELVTRQRIEGVERLRALLDTGTGFIVNFVHLGDYEGITPSMAAAGIPNHNVATSAAFVPSAALWLVQAARVVTSTEGGVIVDVAVGSGGIRDLLAQGKVVTIATDQPGHTPVRFLGHDLMLSSGAARIAKETNVPVVVMTTHPEPSKPHGCGMFRVAEVLDPSEFDSVEALLEVMVRRHEAAFLDWPEAADHPLRMLDRSLVKPPSRKSPPAPSSAEASSFDTGQ